MLESAGALHPVCSELRLGYRRPANEHSSEWQPIGAVKPRHHLVKVSEPIAYRQRVVRTEEVPIFNARCANRDGSYPDANRIKEHFMVATVWLSSPPAKAENVS